MNTRASLAFMILIFCLTICNAQQQKSELHKNVNLRAKGLSHSLNTSKDSLLLNSDQLIYRVSFLYDGNRKSVFDNNSKKINIPIFNLERGKYTVLVYQESRIVVFGITKNAKDIISFASNFKARKSTFTNLSLVISNQMDSIDISKITKNTKTALLSYSLTTKSRSKLQSRKAYRETHLRPNGKPYEK